MNHHATVLSLAPVLARIGLSLMRLRVHGDLRAREKTSQWDIVTTADILSEQMLLDHVRAEYPDDDIVGEEGASIQGTSGRKWYFDPIDGSSNYERGSDFWGISAGLTVDDAPTFGMIHYPALGAVTLSATRGHGAGFVNEDGTIRAIPKWIRPPAGTLKRASVITNIYPGREKLFEVMRQNVQLTCMFNSVVFDVLQLVRGQVDAMFHTGATPFDIAAGIVIARECGCTVRSFLPRNRIDLSQAKIPIAMARSKSLCDELWEVLAPEFP
jgi:myo-inositol-1(or 4)-monophosphatase